ncbi:uncharacterized protein LOC110677650 [Aedes aegypti]|uniref:Uncharacterized protein n=1 Tax=Aedes aegypti TaxID=7159 RepID=A0A6I8U165_AEDAE|nr:uncharacterized protein LOC110677650 [Aedes aegypti]
MKESLKLLGNNYSSLLRIRPGVRVPVVLLLTNFFSHTESELVVLLCSFFIPAASPGRIGLCHFCSAVCCCAGSSGLPSWGCWAVAIRPCYESGQTSGFRSCCCAASIRFWCKSRQNPSCPPFNIGVDHNWLLGHLCSAVCCCADSSGLPLLRGCWSVAIRHCYESGQASGFGSCYCCRVSFLIPLVVLLCSFFVPAASPVCAICVRQFAVVQIRRVCHHCGAAGR